jgi:hypothetical protein
MGARLKTLVLEAEGSGWKEITADTALLGLLRLKSYPAIPPRLRGVRVLRGLTSRYEALAYVKDWRDALCQSQALDVQVCNITNFVDYATRLRAIRLFDLVIVLHSATGDSLKLLKSFARQFRRRRGTLIVFMGNEYELIREKVEFLRSVAADFVCTQLPLEVGRWLYANCASTTVLAMPHALNPTIYRAPRSAARAVDIGFIGASYPPFIGDVERTRLVQTVAACARSWNLSCEIRSKNVPRAEWASFLKRSKGTLGAESGTYYLDRDGEIISRGKAFLASRPDASFDDLHAQVFANPSVKHVSGKCISSRHFEAIGTRTCQVLLEGDYNGILDPGLHYISVKKDLSDLDHAIERFKDDAHREEIAETAYEYVLDAHTYAHRVGTLLNAVGA